MPNIVVDERHAGAEDLPGKNLMASVVTLGDMERFKDSHALIIKPALREGRVVYEAT